MNKSLTDPYELLAYSDTMKSIYCWSEYGRYRKLARDAFCSSFSKPELLDMVRMNLDEYKRLKRSDRKQALKHRDYARLIMSAHDQSS
jgi:hypothetical protein